MSPRVVLHPKANKITGRENVLRRKNMSVLIMIYVSSFDYFKGCFSCLYNVYALFVG